MRYLIVVVALLGAVFAGSGAAAHTSSDSGYTLALSQQPSAQLDVDINVDEAGAWWTNPMWIAIGIIGLVLLVLIVAMAARGGGTTVIKE